MLALLVRGGIVMLGLLLMLIGLTTIVTFREAAAGLWGVALGAFLVVMVAVERQRYRSQTAERAHAAPGPGGGEKPDETLEPRFRPTAEQFIDPSSGHRMRVLVDPATGERRYVAEA